MLGHFLHGETLGRRHCYAITDQNTTSSNNKPGRVKNAPRGDVVVVVVERHRVHRLPPVCFCCWR